MKPNYPRLVTFSPGEGDGDPNPSQGPDGQAHAHLLMQVWIGARERARVLTGSPDEAEEIASAVMQQVLKTLAVDPTFLSNPGVRASYLLLATAHHFSDLQRAKRVRRNAEFQIAYELEMQAHWDDPEEEGEARMRSMIIERALDLVSQRCRDIWHLRNAGKTPKAIAKKLGITPASVSSQVYKAVRVIRDAFAAAGYPPAEEN